jgi:dethiobiotin synthetase
MTTLNNTTLENQPPKHYFITATDTDAGKTYVACALVNALIRGVVGKKVAAYKPLSAGGYLMVSGEKDTWANEDALLLQAHANCQQALSNINPITFEEPIAPHIAAQKVGKSITLTDIENGFNQVQALGADVIVTEGAGGWRLPIGGGHYLSEFVAATKQDVILVVNMKLGCLNHAVLTYESIVNDGLHCVAWVANNQENMPYLAENLSELKQLLPIPLLAELNFEADIDKASMEFNLACL